MIFIMGYILATVSTNVWFVRKINSEVILQKKEGVYRSELS